MPRIRPEGGVVGLNNTPTLATATGMWSMQDVVRNLRNSTWPTAASFNDPYFNLNSLLIHADSTNGKTNVSYVDDSSNAYTATASGKPIQGTFSPFSLTGWSNYFNGSSDYFTLPASSVHDVNTGDFAIELWVYRTVNSAEQYLLSHRSDSPTSGWEWRINATNLMQFFFTGGSSITSTGTIPLNAWTHLAVTRETNTVRFFINGALDSSATFSNGTAAPSIGLYVGFGSTGGGKLTGYMSNVRIVKGSAVYNAAFTPPNAALTAVSGTSLLICQSNRFKDNSTNNFTITPSGAPSVQSFEPFAPGAAYSTSDVGGSAYFNGSTDYITLPNNMTVVGNGAYTLEGWFYPTTTSAGEIPIVKLYNSTQTIELRIVSNKIQGRINSSATIIGGNTTLYPNQWYHFALVKPTAGTSTAVLYINGVAEATTASDNTTYTAFTTPRVGANQSPNIYYTGWASGVRFVRAAQYSGNFTPPTAPPTNVASTLFLLNFTNAGIIDQTSKNNLTTYGSAAVSTTQSKFGGSSMYFDGSSSYLTLLPSPAFAYGTGNFTFEGWIYPTSLSGNPLIWSQTVSGTNYFMISIFSSSSQIEFRFATSGGGTTIYGPLTVTTNQWYHFAVVRSSGSVTVYVNGIGGTPTACTQDFTNTSYVPTIGRYTHSASQYYAGYIDDFRVSRYARYTTNFTPPVAAFTDF